jgi:peptidoglycan/LPS O-acetylase OafA/YrhL
MKGVLTLRGYDYRGAFSANPYPYIINGSLWSISYECWCYLGVVVLGVMGLLSRKRLMLALFLCSIVISVVFLVLHLRPGGKWLGMIVGSPRVWAQMLPYYVSGTVFYLFKQRIPRSGFLAGAATAAVLAGAMLPYGMAIVFPTAGTYLLLWFAFHPSVQLSHWASRGDYSYGIYLYAFPLQQLVIQRFPGITPLTLFAVSTPFAMAAGFLSWHLVEQRFLSRARMRGGEALRHATAVPIG